MRDSHVPSRTAPMRRLFVLGLVFVAAILSCGKDVTGPLNAAARFVRGFAFEPLFPALFQAAGGASSGVVQFTKVHVVLHHTDGTVALDTTVDFPAGNDSITVALTVRLLDNAPAGGEPMTLNLAYINAAGDTVFKGGPVSLTASPPPTGGGANPPIKVPVSYTGPGSAATTVLISPRSGTVVAGAGFQFTAVAKDQNGVVLPAAPVIWNSLDPSIATLTSAASGAGTAHGLRGTARIIAQLFSGAADTVQLNVTLPAAQIIAQSGNAQTGVVGTNLAQPLVVKVAASDGIGVQGTTVNFAVASGGGSVANANVISDANGLAQTTFKLGTLVGANSVTATAGALSNSPLTFTATAQAATAAKLVVTTQPVNGVAGTALTAVVFTAHDNNGNIATTFTGPVVVAFGNNSAGATLSGTLTVNAVAGVAAFSNLLINKNGAAYTLAASSTGLTGATTNAFDVSVGAPKLLVFSVQPAVGLVNAAISPAIVVNAQDSQGNPTPAFTGAVALSFAINPTGATLGGTVSVNAVAGVATFSGVTVSAAGNGYALSATSTGLTSATSATFNIGGGVAATMVIASGAAQTGPPSAALALPVVIQVNDAGGTGIAGTTVTFAVVSGGGSVLPTSGVTNGAGQVQTVWTLGPGLGAQSISATSAGLAGSPLTINATAVAGAATQLVVTTQPSNTVAGVAIAPAITVTAKDASNNPVASYTANVSLAFGANPGGSTLSGVTTIAAVAGVATFNSVSLNKAAAAYTLVASSGALTTATTNPFTVNAAAASTLAISAGQGQSGFTSSALATPLAVTITDAFGNPVTGATVNWAAAGGGSMAPPSSVTNAAGVATSAWTLGATSGAQTATATSGALAGSPATFNATAGVAGFSKTWTGATNTTWSVATNWSPAGVPVPGDSAFIASGGNQPNITSAVTLQHLTVGSGAVLSINGSLTINGNFTVNGSTAGAGVVVLAGTGTVVGSVAPNLTVSGTYIVGAGAGLTTTNGLIVIGSLDMNGQFVNIGGAFQTTGSGTITMTSGATVTVNGNVAFGGGSETGLITAGTFTAKANFAQTGGATSFVASGSNTVSLVAAAAQTLSMANPATSTFYNLTISNPAGVTLGTSFTATNLVTIASGTLSGAGLTATVGYLNSGSGITVANIVFTGSTMSGPATYNANVTINNNPTQLLGNLTVNGNLTVAGNLQLNNRYLVVNGNFSTAASGQLTMVNAADSVQVNGNATFGGGSTGGIMSNGKLKVTGNFSQVAGVGAGGEFQGTAVHAVVFNGVAAQTVNFANPGTSTFGNATFSNAAGVTLATNVVSNGGVTTTAGAVSGGAVGFTIYGTLTDPSTLLAVAAISFATSPTPVSATTPVINSNVTFNASSLLAANLTVNGGVNVNSAVGSLSPNGHTLTINGNLGTSSSGAIAMSSAGDAIVVNGNATFAGGAGVLTNGVLQITGNFTQSTAATAFAASSPHITRFTGAAPTISFANPTTSNFGTLQLQTTGAVTFATNAATSFDIWLKTGTTPSVAGAGTVTAGRAIYDSTGGRWQVSNTVLSGNGALPKTMSTNLTFGAALILTDSLRLTGNALVSGAGAQLDLNGHYMRVSGTFGTAASGALKMTHVNDSLIVKGNASFNGGSTTGLLTAGFIEFDGASFVQGVNASAFAADAPHQTYFWGTTQQQVAFANPAAGSSHFGNLYLADTATVLGSDLFLNGQLQSGGQPTFRVGTLGGGQLVTSNGANLRNVTFDNVRWKTAGTSGAGLFPSIDFVTFQNISQNTLPQFDFEYSTTTNLTLANFSFNSLPTGAGSYIKIVGPDTLTMSSVSPGLTGGFASLSGGGAILGWSNIATWTGAAMNGAWSTATNWNTSAVPASTTDVIINSGAYEPSTGGPITVHNLTVNSGAILTVSGANMTVNGDITVAPTGQITLPISNVGVLAYGNVTTDTAGTTGITGCTGATSPFLNLQAGIHNITGKFCNLSNFGTYTATGPIQVVGSGSYGSLNVGNGSSLNFNGNRVDVYGYSASGTGTITMQNAADSLLVHGGPMQFLGGSETGLMSAGAVIDRAPTFTASGTAFDAAFGTQTFVVDTAFAQTLTWNSAVAGHGFNNVTMKGASPKFLTTSVSDMWIPGTLLLDVSMTSPITSTVTLHVGTLTDNTTITGGGFNGSASLHMTGNSSFQHDSLRVNNVHFDGGGNFILSKNLTTNAVVVDSGSGLILNGHTLKTQGNDFTTQNGGVLGMTNAADSLDLGIANGTAYFNGGTSQLTKGAIAFANLYQGYDGVSTVASSATDAFSPTAGLRAHMATGAGTNIFFKNPGFGAGTSHFWYLQASTSSTARLKSDIFVDSLLYGDFSGANLASDSAAQGVVRTVTTKGVYNSGTFGMSLNTVGIVLNDGSAASTYFQSVTWTGSYGAKTLFTQNRTSAGPTIGLNNFSGASITTGKWINNIGTASLTLGINTSLTGALSACTLGGSLLGGTSCP